MEFVEKHLNDTFYIEGTQRISIRNKIFREVCANLLIHREFSSAYPAKLIIEANQVKTENANKPHGFGLIDANAFSPFPKNPAISKFFREIGLADELGSGIRNINKYLEVYSGEKPEFREEDIFTLIVPIKKQSKSDRNITPHDTLHDTLHDTPHEESVEERIIRFCSIPKTRKEIQEFLCLKDRAHLSKRYLNPMIEKGLLNTTEPIASKSKNLKYFANEGKM